MDALNVCFREGYVYFIRAGRTGAVKIGWARDPQKRLDTLQTGNQHQLHLLGYIPGSVQDEYDWHEMCADLRIRGEWFRLTNTLAGLINRRLADAGGSCFIRTSELSSHRIEPTSSVAEGDAP